MLIKRFQQLAQWVGFLAIAGLALYGLVNLGSGRLWAAGAESRTAATDAPQITIPSTFNYQGFLRDGQGNPITGTRKIKVTLWNAVTAGIGLHAETFTDVSVRDGLFNVVMGSTQSMDPSFFQNVAPLFVGISVDDGAELLPRQRIHPVPWAILATNAQNATTATTASTATTLVPDAAVPGLNVTSILRTGNVNGPHIYIDGDDIRARSGSSTARLDLNYGGGDVVIGDGNSTVNIPGRLTVNGSINDEENPLVIDVGSPTDTTHWNESYTDIGSRCGDADGCTIKILLRRSSDDYIHTIAEQIYIEQPNKSGNKSPGLHGYARQLGGGDTPFVLGTAAKLDLIPAPFGVIWIRNYASIYNGQLNNPASPVYTGYNVSILTAPDWSATVYIYDR